MKKQLAIIGLVLTGLLLTLPLIGQPMYSGLAHNQNADSDAQNTGLQLYALAGVTGYDLTQDQHIHGPTLRLGFRYEINQHFFIHGGMGMHRMTLSGESTSFSSWEGGFGFYPLDGFSVGFNFAYYTAAINNRGGYGINIRPTLDLIKLGPNAYLTVGTGLELYDANFAFSGLIGVTRRFR